eukprot:7567125-Pyramimonas_sp.AAC.2
MHTTHQNEGRSFPSIIRSRPARLPLLLVCDIGLPRFPWFNKPSCTRACDPAAILGQYSGGRITLGRITVSLSSLTPSADFSDAGIRLHQNSGVRSPVRQGQRREEEARAPAVQWQQPVCPNSVPISFDLAFGLLSLTEGDDVFLDSLLPFAGTEKERKPGQLRTNGVSFVNSN